MCHILRPSSILGSVSYHYYKVKSKYMCMLLICFIFKVCTVYTTCFFILISLEVYKLICCLNHNLTIRHVHDNYDVGFIQRQTSMCAF